ncbi:IMP dehydrogenase [Ileibacterium valens]|uniref:Inosine 5-monophosphate dehydrogenase n=1 Tax=Ileibacterium valens TaxID=1862668 RepID=A0A1U7NCF3_9FIRM|nr:IMP dehydrogenase [Ileibacterium valens]OLU36154.1 inosine 5-monophosphate dehydrogenase [Ileibacterium valens]OLU38726.1 inosine 5-monophosphate dehydrogenase [Erysipelotrichaceae bacterium NYU-BL-E8]OLU38920.1 inosine 5-monophosphate dehydrogenase [Erysipelotrichaceae bacterium NYU-BL-F16]
MAIFFKEPSRTFSEYLLVPGYTGPNDTPDKVSLRTPLVKFKKGEEPALSLNIPLTSAVMQAVSGPDLAVALAKEGGISFIFGSQSIASQAAMIREVKSTKAGFVGSDANIAADATLREVIKLRQKTGHSTMAVTDNGQKDGKLLGIITSRDFRETRVDLDNSKVADYMTPFENLVVGKDGITLSEANDIIWDHKLNQLPIVDDEQHLVAFVFRKDYEQHKEHPYEVLDDKKRFLVGAGINSRDYKERVPALVEAGADIFVIDSSEGYSVWQKETIEWIRNKYGDTVKIGAGNVVDGDGFRYLAEAGADFVKIGIGGGSICITREQKGIGRGQATATIEVAKARDEYYKNTGVYVPICSDGGIVQDYHITLALAFGADFVMLGRYFARFKESPSKVVTVNGNYMKEYWGEGSARARNWQRYDLGGEETGMSFVEGVDSYVPYAGALADNVGLTLSKIRHTMSNCGVMSIEQLQKEAKVTLVSSVSITEGGAHDVLVRDNNVDATQS